MTSNPSTDKIKDFVENVDSLFIPPLSARVNLLDWAGKLNQKATICFEGNNEGAIIALVAGYTENIVENLAYISVVAVLPDYSGSGLATKLLNEFIQICGEKDIHGVHVYTEEHNMAARILYSKLGFQEWNDKTKERQGKVHFLKIL